MAADRGAKVTAVNSLLPYQIILYLNGYYAVVYTVCEILMFIYKGQTLPYPPGNLAVEIVVLLILAAIEAFRLFFGKRGNLTERGQPVILSILLSVPCALGHVFLLIWQTYVLRAELIIIAIELTFIAVEILLGLVAVILFSRAGPY
ncbi:transmembrane protein 216-like [Watersipora subatra]|uniref:transmembrane protein 216-like n=1 Tax=Watersipora subatra TaxID=2589382 RepID=UPI00355C6499